MNRLSSIGVLLLILALPFVDALVPWSDNGFRMPYRGGDMPAGADATLGDGAKQAESPTVAMSESPYSLVEWQNSGGNSADGTIPTVESALREASDRSKEASDGVGESGHGDPGVAISGASSAGSPDNSGLVFQGTLTWVHPDLAGDLMADGVTRYDPQAIGPVAATAYPLGAWLELCGPTRRCIGAIVSDTGMLRVSPPQLDVSEAMFQVLVGDLAIGVGQVEIQVLE